MILEMIGDVIIFLEDMSKTCRNLFYFLCSVFPLFIQGSSTPSNSRRESVGSADWTKQRLGRKRKTEDDLFEEYERPAKLGDVYASSITSQIELDVFDVVDHLLTQVAIMVHGQFASLSFCGMKLEDQFFCFSAFRLVYSLNEINEITKTITIIITSNNNKY